MTDRADSTHDISPARVGSLTYRVWRRTARRFARLHGFYWLPCVLCGREHGGQEASGAIPDPEYGDDFRRRITICPECTARLLDAAQRRLAELGETEITAGQLGSLWSGSHNAIKADLA